MQKLSSENYHRGHEFEAFRAQGAVDSTHFSNRWTSSQLMGWIDEAYNNVPSAP